MRLDKSLDELVDMVLGMDREACVRELRSLPRVYSDFSDAYLAERSLDELRHLLVAACMQARKARHHGGDPSSGQGKQ